MQNCLHLVGDGDDVDVVRDVEREFQIRISDEEARATQTVGALHDLIEAKCRPGHTQVCQSQRAFYRLRHALAEMGVAERITPDTPISVIAKKGRISRSWKELGQRSALNLPRLETPFRSEPPSKFVSRTIWIVAAGMLFAGFLLWEKLGFSRGTVWLVAPLMISLALVSWYVVHLAFRNIPLRIRTIGDLAQEAAGHSFAALKDDRDCSAADRWQALVAILRDISGHKGPVTRETRFFAN